MRATPPVLARIAPPHHHSHLWCCTPTSRVLPYCPTSSSSTFRCIHISPLLLKTCTWPRFSRRSLSSSHGHFSTPTPPEVAATDRHEDEDEDLRVDIFRTRISPEEAENKAKTDLFLCLLLTLPHDQDWKDMLVAAFRAGTWRPHHLDAVLRGIKLNKYNEPIDCALSCSGNCAASLSPSHLKILQDSIADVAQSAPASSTASARLQRAKNILVFCAEEGGVYAAPSESSSIDGSLASSSQPAEKSPRHMHQFLPSPAAAHRLLVQLLQAAQRGADAASSFSEPNISSQPVTSFHDVWHYLAWMELHGYHVLSSVVLDALEAVIDEGGVQDSSGPSLDSTKTVRPAAGVASPVPRQYAIASQRIHRLDYLRRERALLCESMKGSEQGADGATTRTELPQSRRPDIPRTSPVHTE